MLSHLDLLIKPASGRCNLNCSYCFYKDLQNSRSVSDRGLMTLDTAEVLIKKVCEETEVSVTFGFQGGEPLLAGLDFFRGFVSLWKKHNRKNLRADFTLQTNGTLLGGDWCGFFRENNFLVGLSLDGDKSANDRCRLYHDGESTFDEVLNAAELLKSFGVDFNILTVVTNENALRPRELYGFFKDKGFNFLQFIPALADFGQNQNSLLSSENYGSFLCGLFECWLEDFEKGRYISIRDFDNFVGILLGRRPESCAMNGVCTPYALLEADGSLYPCDFYVLDGFCLGNIKSASFEDMLTGKKAEEFRRASEVRPEACRKCPYLSLCRGGCRRNRNRAGLNNFCRSYMEFFKKHKNGLVKAADIIKEGSLY